MSHWKLTAAALLVASTGPSAAAQCVTVFCEDMQTQFVSDPIVSERTGTAPLPPGSLTLPKFDPTVYAGIHGTTAGNVTLKGVSIDFLASIDPLIQLDSGSGPACTAPWSYSVGAVIFADAATGMPGALVTFSQSGTASLPAGNGAPPPWDVTVNPSASSDAFCFGVTDQLGIWTGVGEVSFLTDTFGVGSASGCDNVLSNFTNATVLRATLRFTYCVGGGGSGGPGFPYCFGDGTGAPCPCGNTAGAGEGCANSSGNGGVLTGTGTNSVGVDDLGFAASNLLQGQPALLFAGLNALNGGNGTVFGDGLRCAGGSIARLGVKTPNAQGNATWGPNLQGAGGWTAGDTRRFQAWYRNPTGGPCGSGFNLTNGYEVSFMP